MMVPSPVPAAILGELWRVFAPVLRNKAKSIPLLSAGALIGVEKVLEPLLFGRAINAIHSSGGPMPFVLFWCTVSILGFFAAIVITLLTERMAHRRRLELIGDVVEHILALSTPFQQKTQSGRLMRIVMAGADTLFFTWIALFRDQITNVAALVVVIPTAFLLNWRLAILLMALLLFFFVTNTLVIRRTSVGQALVESCFNDMSGRIGDVLANVPIVQSFSAEKAEVGGLRRVANQLLRAQYPVLTWWSASTALTSGASSIAFVAMFGIGVGLIAQNLANVGDIVTFIGFATLLIGRLEMLAVFVTGLAERLPAFRQFHALLDEQSTVHDAPGAMPLVISGGEIVLDRVSLVYGEGSVGVADLSLTVRPGETVALVGQTGAGKSSVLALIQRIFDPTTGRVLIDGQDLRDVTLESLRHGLAVVHQEAGLFGRSILDNILIGRPAASRSDVEDVARTAEAFDFILAKPQGFETPLGERGSGLSGGERQRVALARAILKDAAILLLDEATSALDTITERRLQGKLRALRDGRTTIIVAHRLSTIVDADRIIVLAGGRVAEQGTFAELIARQGTFAELARELEKVERREYDQTCG